MLLANSFEVYIHFVGEGILAPQPAVEIINKLELVFLINFLTWKVMFDMENNNQ